MIASISAAAAVLRIAPIFPGFSGDSITKTLAFFVKISLSNFKSFAFTIAIIFSEPERIQILSNNVFSTS